MLHAISSDGSTVETIKKFVTLDGRNNTFEEGSCVQTRSTHIIINISVINLVQFQRLINIV